jgi:hypothetical protein
MFERILQNRSESERTVKVNGDIDEYSDDELLYMIAGVTKGYSDPVSVVGTRHRLRSLAAHAS